MSDYDALLGTVARIADAAIEWDMNLRGWHKAENGWVSDLTVSSGTTYLLDFAGMSIRDLHYGDLYPVGEGGFSQYNYRPLWRSWYERANEAFRPWLGLPDPGDFERPIGSLQSAAGSLNVNTTVVTSGAGPEAGLESGNLDLDANLYSLTGEIIAMNGVAMDRFALDYSNRLPGVIRGQLAITAMLGCCLTAEQNLWKQARLDVARIADDVLVVMKEQGGGDGGAKLKILGAVLAGASLFFSGGASAAVISNGRAIVGLLSGFLPADQALTPDQQGLAGSTPSEVHGKLLDLLETLGTAARAEERLIQQSLTGSSAEVGTGTPDAFELGDRPELLGVPDDGVLHPRDIDVKPDTLVILGTDVVPAIAATLRSARRAVADAAGSAPWERKAAIGLGPTGAYDDWAVLHSQLLDVLTGTSRTLEDVGGKLVDVAALFVEVDRDVSQDYGRLTPR